MRPEESHYSLDWLRIPERDLARVQRCLGDNDPEAAALFLQQAMAKFLKAFLLSSGWQLRRIHDLEALLDDAVAYDQELESFRPLCQRVTDYYLVERYPLLGVTGPTDEEVRASSDAVQPLLERIRHALGAE